MNCSVLILPLLQMVPLNCVFSPPPRGIVISMITENNTRLRDHRFIRIMRALLFKVDVDELQGICFSLN